MTCGFSHTWNNVANCGFLLKDAIEDAPPPDGPYIRFHSHRKDSLPYLEVTTAEQQVPFLTQWGLFILVVLIMFSAWVILRKKRVAIGFRQQIRSRPITDKNRSIDQAGERGTNGSTSSPP